MTDAGWTVDQLDRKARAEAGECVVANMHKGADAALIAWAKAEGRFVLIDRKSPWGNPFEMPDDGDRPTVVAKYANFYLPHKPGLLSRLPTLRGKVLGCWCHPEQCHGHVIAARVNDLERQHG
ncbi:MAG: DUF4326 domain-containing protein [Acetobacteraceae bacterium]|nr:DUF4326 domain-containing protein [Acetobacteraceae bacterium]